MRYKLVAIIFVLFVALIPASAIAQVDEGQSESDDVLIRINGPIVIPEDSSVDTVISISDQVLVAGEVRDVLVIIDGTATVAGQINGDVVVISGDITLLDSARITGDLNLYDSTVERASGAVVEGSVNDRPPFTWSAWDTFVVSILFWVAMTILVLFTALLFAGAGGRQLVRSASYITERPGETILATVIGGFLIPAVAIFAFLTVFGIPVGLSLLLILMPLMALLGYIVVGTRIGLALVARNRSMSEMDHPYVAALLGVMILNIVGLIPFIGAVVQFIAAVLGAGALALLAWNAWRSGGPGRAEATTALEDQPIPAT